MAIRFVEGSPPSDEETFGKLRPYVATWFREEFGEMTPPQKCAIPLIRENRNTLVFSSTGSGKTLAAFLSMINKLFAMGEKGELQDTIYVLYVSPLRALNNDIRRNLMAPLEGIREVSRRSNVELPIINVAVRTGDTSQSERNRMLRHPPHILITTPETLSIVLTSPKFSERLKTVKWVIIDEIHELCDSKRGVHLSLSLERLQQLIGEDKEFVRVGCSATQAPVEEIAKFLVGHRDDGSLRDCNIVDVYSTKSLDIRVECPVSNLAYASYDSATDHMYDLLKEQIDTHTTTLVFTNTRSGTERIAFRLKELYGDEGVDNLAAHHGSLSRDTRLDVEERLKKGLLKAVVSSTSLELGIDIGYIDLVCQIGSPKSVAKGLQRIGRAGHALHETSKGRLMVFDLDDLVECTVLVKSAYDGKIDRVAIPRNCLDVLAQHLVGMSIQNKWSPNDAFRLVKRSYCYHDLTYEDFIGVIKYLAGEHVSLEERGVYRKIWYDEEQQVFGRKRGSRMIYYLNIGTIPEESNYKALLEEYRTPLGQLSESFVERLQPGDIIVLGGRAYEFRRTSGMKVYVRAAYGRRPTVPSWTGEMLPRSYDLSCDIGRFRQTLADKIRKEGLDAARAWLLGEFKVDERSAESIMVYFRNQLAITGTVPTDKRIIIEGYFDRKGRANIVFHSVYGRRVNDALSRAYGYAISRAAKVNVGTAILDDGFVITLPAGKTMDLAKIPSLVTPENVEELIRKAVRKTELFKQRFRHCAVRSFMVLRMYKGWEISVSRQQSRSIKVLDLLEGMEDFPVIKETYREILDDVMDMPNALNVVNGLKSGSVEFRILPLTDVPSPFSHSLILVGAEDVVLMEDREALLRELHRQVLARVVGEGGDALFSEKTVQTLYDQRQHLTPETKGKVKEDIQKILHDIGPAEIFKDTYPTIIDKMAVDPDTVRRWSEELVSEGKVIMIRTPKGDSYGVAVEDFPMFYHVFKSSPIDIDDLESSVLRTLGEKPLKTIEVAEALDTKPAELRRALRRLERAMLIVRSKYVIGSIKEESKETTWDLLSRHLPMDITAKLEQADPEDEKEKSVKRYLWSIGPCIASELAAYLNMSEEEAERILKRLERMGELFSGYFVASKPPGQYLLAEDRELLKQIEKKKELTRFSESTVTELVLEKQHLTPTTRCLGEEGILTVVGELGPIRTHRALYHRITDFDLDWLRKLWAGEKKIVVGRFTERGLSYIRKSDLPFYVCLRDAQRNKLPDTSNAILKVIQRENPITKGRIIALTGYDKSTVEVGIEKLEESLLILRTIPYETDIETQRVTLYEPVENYISQTEKLNRNEGVRAVVHRIIEAHGPITIQGIISLSNLQYEEVENTLAILRKEGLILSGQFIEGIPIETYLTAKDLQRLKEISHTSAESSPRDVENQPDGKIIVDVLSNLDPYTWRISQQLSDLYGSAFLNPLIVDGVLAGAADVRVTQDLLHVADMKVSEILLERQDLIERVAKRFIDIASYYGLMAVEVELVWGQPAVCDRNEKIVRIFTEAGYEIAGDRLCWGETPSEIFDEEVVREFQFRKQHVHPDTRGNTKEDIYRILRDIGGVWAPWEDKLSIRIEGLRREWIEDLLKKDKLILEDTLLASKTMLIPLRDWSTYWWACKTPLKLTGDAMKLLQIIKEEGPISRKALIRRSLMHQLDVEHLLSTLSHMRTVINVASRAKAGSWVSSDEWFPSGVRYDESIDPHEARTRVVFKLLKSLGPLTVSQLREMTGFHSRHIRLLLTELKDRGKIGLGRFMRSSRTQIQFVALDDLDQLHALSSTDGVGKSRRLSGSFTVPPGDPIYFALKDEIKSTFRTSWCYSVLVDGRIVAAFKLKGANKRHFLISDLLLQGRHAESKDLIFRIADQIDQVAISIGAIDIELKMINGKAVTYEGNKDIVEFLKLKGYRSGGLVLYKAFSVAVQPSGKEAFAEDVCVEFLMRRQHLSPLTKGEGNKDGILRVLHDIGPVSWSDSIAIRIRRFNPNDLDELKWRDRRIIHGRFLGKELTQVPTDELLDYYYASRPPSLLLGYDDQRLIDILCESGPIDQNQIATRMSLDIDSVRRLIENVEVAARVVRVRRSDSVYSSDEWLYDVIDHYLADGTAQFENVSPKEARKKIVLKFLGANGPVSLRQIEEWSHMELAEVKSALSELEAEGRITSSVYIEGIAARRYARKEDLAELRALEERYLSQKLASSPPYYITLPNYDPVVRTWKDELLRTFTIGLIDLGADYYMLTLRSGKPVASMQVHYEMNSLRIHDLEVLGSSDDDDIVFDVIGEIERTARDSRKMEIQIEHIGSRTVKDKLNKQQLDKFIEKGFTVEKDLLWKKL